MMYSAGIIVVAFEADAVEIEIVERVIRFVIAEAGRT